MSLISEYDDLVWRAVDAYGVPPTFSREQWFALINSVIEKESAYNPRAVSYTGAGIGLMQVNPNVWLSVFGLTRDALFDPWINIATGTQILKQYVSQYGTHGGLGAYFAGPANRLSQAAQSYAQKVLSIYQSIIYKVRQFLQPQQPLIRVSGGYWFVEPEQPATTFFEPLPEPIPEGGNPEIPQATIIATSADNTLFYLAVGVAALAILS